MAQHGLGFVGSLPPSDHPALLAIAKRHYRVVSPDRYGGLTFVDTTVTALGVTRRAVLTHSPVLHAKQSRGLDQTLAKAQRSLQELADRLARGKTRRDRTVVQADIVEICKPRWVNNVLTWTLTGDTPADLRLTYHVNAKVRAALERRIFGKRILFTNRTTWTVEQVVAAYRSQSDAEGGFRRLKDPHTVSYSPMFHWADQKIRVHTFYCVLALTLAHLMRRHADQAGPHMSIRDLLSTPAGIQEPSCSTTTAPPDAPAPNASSPIWTPPNAGSTNSSTSAPHPHPTNQGSYPASTGTAGAPARHDGAGGGNCSGTGARSDTWTPS
jgi:hypothetical protein